MDFVHYNVTKARQGVGLGVNHVAQYFGSHNYYRGFAIDGIVPGKEADIVLAVTTNQIVELLIGQSLDRCGVEALSPGHDR